MIYLIRHSNRFVVQKDWDTCPLNPGPRWLLTFFFQHLGPNWQGTVDDLPEVIQQWYADNPRVLPGLAKPPGRDAITSWIQELSIYGYAEMAVARENGQFRGHDLHIYESTQY